MSEIPKEAVYKSPTMFEVDVATVPPKLRDQAEMLLGALAALDAQVIPICEHESRIPESNKNRWFYEEVSTQPSEEKGKEFITLVAVTLREAEAFIADRGHHYPGVVAGKVFDMLCDVAKAEEDVISTEPFPLQAFTGVDGVAIVDAATILPALQYIKNKKIATQLGPGGNRFLHDFAKAALRDFREGKIKLRIFKFTDHSRPQAL